MSVRGGAAHGLPTRRCGIVGISAAGDKVALAVDGSRYETYGKGLYMTGDGGRTWRPIKLEP